MKKIVDMVQELIVEFVEFMSYPIVFVISLIKGE